MVDPDCTRCTLSKGRKKVVLSSKVKLNKTGIRILFLIDNPNFASEAFGKLGIGPELDFLERLVRAAAPGNEVKDFYYMSMVKCIPKSVQVEFDYYSPIHVLKCSHWVYKEIETYVPDLLVFIGKEVQEFYAKEFKGAITIPLIRAMIRQGGSGSPFYNFVLRTLTERIKDAQKIKTTFEII